MHKKLLWIFLLFCLTLSSKIHSQEDVEFKPSGRIIGRVFLDYSTGFGNKNKESGFDITRAFLGYNYKFTRSLEARVILDGAAGKNDKGKLEPYIRNAFVTWRDKGFSISAGLIGLQQYKTQENYWTHRYIYKSFQDEYKMGASADVGITASYKFSSMLSIDATITNGEGYKKIEKNSSTRYGMGVSVAPNNNLLFRVYGDIYNESAGLRDVSSPEVVDGKYRNQYSLSLFTGYKNNSLSVGVEYNHQFNRGFVKEKNSRGYSAYGTLKLAPKWNVFGRYDFMESSAPNTFISPWNNLDEQLMMIGVEFSPVKQINISPNFRNLNPRNGKSEQYLFVNLEFNI